MKWPTSCLSRWATATVGPILLTAAFLPAFAADSPLVGAWQLDPGQSGQAALYLFTPTRYSMVLAATGRPDIADTSKATADELRALWGPILANAGTYEVSGDLITIHAIVAKSPAVMKPDATEVYRDSDTEAGAKRTRCCRRLGAHVQIRTRGMKRRPKACPY